MHSRALSSTFQQHAWDLLTDYPALGALIPGPETHHSMPWIRQPPGTTGFMLVPAWGPPASVSPPSIVSSAPPQAFQAPFSQLDGLT